MKILVCLVASCFAGLIPVASCLPFFLPDHPFIPPVYQEYNGKNISLQRGPCPGLNTLANHGYINRNGTGISVQDLSEAAKVTYGADPEFILDIVVGNIASGMKINQTANGSTSIDLFDLYNHNRPEHDASMVRQDRFFEEFGQFDETLFDELLEYAFDNGTISFDNLYDFRVGRIHHSRLHNPDFFLGESSIISIILQTLTLLALADDPDAPLIQVDNLRMFLQENRLPDTHLPVQEKGYPLVSPEESVYSELFSKYDSKIRQAITEPLESDPKWTGGKLAALIIPLSFISLSLLIVLYWFLKRNAGSQERDATAVDFNSVQANYHEDAEADEGSTSHILRKVVSDQVDSTQESSEMVDEVRYSTREANSEEELRWSGLTLSPKKAPQNLILHDVTGTASAGKLTGLMGHSGSGKSSLLGILRGRHSSGMNLKGKVEYGRANEDQNSKDLPKLAYVSQEDSFVTTVTVRESIRFSARMRLPKSRSDKYVEDLTDRIIDDLGLKHIKDICMHDKNGPSGGEKRRVSLGLALVVQPKILLLDEVTSGLDSSNAVNVVQTCSWLAKKNGTVILMSIHQPSSKIFQSLDNVIMLSHGRCMFDLPAKEVAPFFFARGFEVPEGYNTAEWALQVSLNYSHKILCEHGFCFVKSPDFDTKKAKEGETCFDSSKTKSIQRISFLHELKTLTGRETVIRKRGWSKPAFKSTVLVSLGIMFAFFFGNVGSQNHESFETFTSHVALLFLLLQGTNVILILEAPEASADRQVFCREYSTGHYRLISYIIVKTIHGVLSTAKSSILVLLIVYWTTKLQGRFWYLYLVFMTYGAVCSALGYAIIGLAKNAAWGRVLAPIVTIPQVMMCGFLVTQDSLPSWSSWVVWITPLTYAFRLGLGEEFRSCTDFSEDEQAVMDCISAFQNSPRNLLDAYNDESILNLAQVGSYRGAEAITEYLAYFSTIRTESSANLFWDFCQVKGTQSIILNEVDAKNGVCDVSIAGVSRARVNQFISMQATDEASYFQAVQVNRVRLQITNSLDSMKVLSQSIFLPPAFMDHLYGEALNPAAMNAQVCLIQERFCPHIFESAGFEDKLDCTVQMNQNIPLSDVNSQGLIVVDSNSTGCRHIHAFLAALHPEVHCAHISYFPFEDPTGAVKCSQSRDLSIEEFFPRSNQVLFGHVAAQNDLDPDTLFRQVMGPEEDIGTCVGAGLVEPEAILTSNDLPSNFECYSYLEVQGATGEEQVYYWIALVSFFVFFKMIGYFMFWVRAKTY